MKNFNKLLMLIVFVISGNIYTQTFEEQKQEIINSLSDSTNNAGCNGIDLVIEFDIEEALPTILENIWKQSAHCRTNYLWALCYFKAEETESIALAMLDSLNGFGNERFNKFEASMPQETFEKMKNKISTELLYKLKVVQVLFELGNYEKYQIVFDRIGEVKPALAYGAIFMLPEIIFHHPEHEERAKNELIKFAYESDDEIFKSYAVTCLDTVYGEAMIDVYLDVFSSSTDYGVRLGILDDILQKYPSTKVNEVLRQMLYDDENAYNRLEIARVLLKQYGTTSDYMFVKNYLSSEPDEEYKSSIEREINNFKSPKPDSNVTITTMLDTLISYTNQSYNYEWITNKGIYNSLSKKLENAKKDLEKREITTKNIIQAYQNEVDAQNGKHIAEDGYKFLHYFSDYIIKRIK